MDRKRQLMKISLSPYKKYVILVLLMLIMSLYFNQLETRKFLFPFLRLSVRSVVLI